MDSESNSGGVNTVAIVIIFAVLILVGAWFVLGRGGAPAAPAAPAQQAPAPAFGGGNEPAPVNPPGGGDNPAPQPPPPSKP